MNRQMAGYIQDNFNEIISSWQELMKNEKNERSFQVMPTDLMNQTSKEFADLMVSNLLESHQAYENRLNDFAEKVVRLGWSMTFVTKAITHFSEVVFDGMENAGIINENNFRAFSKEFTNWINPIQDSTIDTYS